MFSFGRKGTVIAEGLKIVGSVTAEGLVEVNGQVEGDLHCTSLIVSPKACIRGGVQAERVVVNGKIEGPIRGGDVVLKSRAVVVGDIQTESLTIENGAFFEGRSLRANDSNMPQAEKVGTPLRREIATKDRDAAAAETSAGRIAPVPAGSAEDRPRGSGREATTL
jgi:cytoskeletal protein CcmA (bactofilin family)